MERSNFSAREFAITSKFGDSFVTFHVYFQFQRFPKIFCGSFWCILKKCNILEIFFFGHRFGINIFFFKKIFEYSDRHSGRWRVRNTWYIASQLILGAGGSRRGSSVGGMAGSWVRNGISPMGPLERVTRVWFPIIITFTEPWDKRGGERERFRNLVVRSVELIVQLPPVCLFPRGWGLFAP